MNENARMWILFISLFAIFVIGCAATGWFLGSLI